MSNSADFLAHVLELMRPTAGATANTRPMFGGHGLYADGVIVGIVIDDVVYLKTDEVNRAEFAALGLAPFVYATRHGDSYATSYFRAPDDALDNVATMADWLRSAMGASLRKPAVKPAKRARTTAAKI